VAAVKRTIDESNPHKELLALFANPKFARHSGLGPLPIGRDIKHLLRSMDIRDVAIEPAATLEDARTSLISCRPHILSFSGHTFMGTLAFEDENGRFDDHARPQTFGELLLGSSKAEADTPTSSKRKWSIVPDVVAVGTSWSKEKQVERRITPDNATTTNEAPTSSTAEGDSHEMLRRLQCIVLNGCRTKETGVHLLSCVPHVSIVCWETLAEDAAARAFATGFYESIHKQRKAALRSQLRRASDLLRPRPVLVNSTYNIADAFIAGCQSFMDAGFTFGDPEDFLHPPAHPHCVRPDYKGCPGCIPPVHGECVLLTSSEELKGSTVVAVDRLPSSQQKRRQLQRRQTAAKQVLTGVRE